MRILHLTDHYLPVLGGIETHVAALAARQAARGDEVTVLTTTTSTADGREVDDRGPVDVRRVGSVLEGLREDLSGVDVVHAHVSVVAPFTAPVVAVWARRRVPVVVTVHSLWNGLGPVPALAAHLAGLRTAPVLWTSVSRTAAAQLEKRLPAGTTVGILPNAVAVSARAHSPAPRPDGSVRLVSTMRVARRKRPMALLRMFARLRASVDVPVELTVVGDGPLRGRLERRAHRSELQDAVWVTGRVEPDEVLARLAEADLYVAPAELESFGLAALEARCVGLPVVGHADSGMTDFVRHGVEGLLCRSDADMVLRLRALVLDGALRERIAEHNRTTPATMTWPSTMAAHDAAYALARARRRTPAVRDLFPVGGR